MLSLDNGCVPARCVPAAGLKWVLSGDRPRGAGRLSTGFTRRVTVVAAQEF